MRPRLRKSRRLMLWLVVFAFVSGAARTQTHLSGTAVRALIAAVAKGGRITLAGRDMTGDDLTGLDFSGADLRGAQLTRANLHGVKLVGADFTGAYLAGADFTGARLTGASFESVDLRGAKGLSAPGAAK